MQLAKMSFDDFLDITAHVFFNNKKTVFIIQHILPNWDLFAVDSKLQYETLFFFWALAISLAPSPHVRPSDKNRRHAP